MGNRCENCARFVSLEVGEPEVSDLEISIDGEVTGNVYVTTVCTECGGEMSYLDFQIEETCEEAAEHILYAEDATCELSIEEDTIEGTEEFGGLDRKGRPITNYRSMKKFYGYSLEATISCKCGWSTSMTIAGQEQANSFEPV